MNRHCGRPVWGILVIASVVSLAAPTVRLLAAETFGYTSRKPQLWETERPVLEEEPGTNLYWHDPHLASWEACRIWPPATNGCMPAWYAQCRIVGSLPRRERRVRFRDTGPERSGGPVDQRFPSGLQSGHSCGGRQDSRDLVSPGSVLFRVLLVGRRGGDSESRHERSGRDRRPVLALLRIWRPGRRSGI